MANPLALGANVNRILQGQNINPKDISVPGAKVIAPLAGTVVGGIYGGPMGAVAGGAAGQQVGGPLQNLGGQSDKAYAHGGMVTRTPTGKEGDMPSPLFHRLLNSLRSK